MRDNQNLNCTNWTNKRDNEGNKGPPLIWIIAECTHLTKYFGPYNITKTNENKFIFTKGDESALVSKSGW